MTSPTLPGLRRYARYEPSQLSHLTPRLTKSSGFHSGRQGDGSERVGVVGDCTSRHRNVGSHTVTRAVGCEPPVETCQAHWAEVQTGQICPSAANE